MEIIYKSYFDSRFKIPARKAYRQREKKKLLRINKINQLQRARIAVKKRH